jgi:hypothetical protein
MSYAAGKNAKPVTSLCAYGYSHRSKLERAVCDMIAWEERAGITEHLDHEFTVYLTDARYKCIPDFRVKDVATGEVYFHEAKGYANARWATTKKLWAVYGPGRLKIWGGNWRRPSLEKEIVPKGVAA